MIAAHFAARSGVRTLLLEKNTKPGVKILMSGGTRCNLTHDTDIGGILAPFPKNQARFLRSAVHAFPPESVVSYFEQSGVPTKIEANGKIFPRSDRAVDVQRALRKNLETSGAELRLQCAVKHIRTTDGPNRFCVQTSDETFLSRRLLVTTGGSSYPGCGTTGDGYTWMEELGHSVVPPRPALVPLVSSNDWVRDLTGITLEDAQVSVVPTSHLQAASDVRALNSIVAKRAITSRRTSLLFTHTGLSGPAAMDVSRALTSLSKFAEARLVCDFLPSVDLGELSDTLDSLCQQHGARTVGRFMSEHTVQRLGDELLKTLGLPADRRLAELGRSDRHHLLKSLKLQTVDIVGTRGFAKAEVTAGGVNLKEVNPKTMESRQHPGLYIAGELLDIDGPIGGYNFQAAFSTGRLAALSAAHSLADTAPNESPS